MKISRNQYHYAVRRVQKNINKTNNDKLLNTELSGKHFFKELNKTGKCKETISNVMDEIHGASNISEHFRKIYENLFNAFRASLMEESTDIASTIIVT